MDNKEKITLFLDLESTNELMNRQIADVPYWSMIRGALYYELTAEKGFLSKAHPDMARTFRDMLFNAPVVLWQALRHNGWFNIPQADVLFVLCPRKIQSERGPISIMLDFFCDELDRSFCIFEKPFRYRHIKYQIKRNILYSDYFEIKRILFNKLGIGKKIVLKAAAEGEFDFLDDFNEKFNKDISLNWLIKKVSFCVATHKACFKSFCSLLRKMGTKCVVEDEAYAQESQIMTLAAHALNIPVLELQHGIINDLHFAYNYKTANLLSQPDKTLTWGEFWTKDIVNPRKNSFIPCGYPFFEAMVKNGLKHKNTKSILIVSQGPFSDCMIQIALELNSLLADHGYKIIFKLHPSQCLTWREKYPELVKYENEIEVVDNPQKGIYDCFNEVSFQIGVSSTALIEGLAWGLETFILEHGMYKYMEYLYRNNYAFLVKDAREIAEKILSGQKADIPSANLFWTKDAKRNVIAAIQHEIAHSSYGV